MTTGSVECAGEARIVLVSCSPSRPGISKSDITRAMSSSWSSARSASSPSRAVMTWYPTASKMLRCSSRTVNESSTTSTLAGAAAGDAGGGRAASAWKPRMRAPGSSSNAIRPSPRMAAPR
jgi:hypothetical protein